MLLSLAHPPPRLTCLHGQLVFCLWWMTMMMRWGFVSKRRTSKKLLPAGPDLTSRADLHMICEQDLLKCQVHITLMVAMIYELAIRESPIFSSIHLNQVQYTSSSNISWAVIKIFKKLGKLIVLVLEHILSCAIIQGFKL